MITAVRSRWIWLGALAVAAACAEGQPVDDAADGAGATTALGGRSPSPFGGASFGTGGSAAGSGGRPAGAAAGTSGTAVEAGSGGEAGGEGPTEPEVCALGEGGAGDGAPFVVTLKANTDAPMDFPQGEVAVSNAGDEPVELASLELRYYFQSEYGAAETPGLEVRIHYADVSGGLLYRTITALVSGEVAWARSADPSADAYVAVRFDSAAGSLEPGEKTIAQFQVRPPAGHDDYYAVQDQRNDYSFGACWLRHAPWERLVLFVDGAVASGAPPSGGSGEGGAGGAAGSGAE